MYILRIHLLENPDVVFFYNGISRENRAPFALNVIVAFEFSDAMMLDKQTAMELCKKLNLNKLELNKVGYSEFEVLFIDA